MPGYARPPSYIATNIKLSQRYSDISQHHLYHMTKIRDNK